MHRLAFFPLVTLLVACTIKDASTASDSDGGTTALSGDTTGDATDGGTGGGTGGATTGPQTTGEPSTTTGEPSTTTGATTGAPVDDCAFLVGKTFLSDAELECGLGPNGPVLCHWTISFTDVEFTHQYSDIGESGPYPCVDGVITAGNHLGTVDAVAGTLVWDDVPYNVA